MVAIGIVGSICFGNLPELNNVILNEGSRAIEFTHIIKKMQISMKFIIFFD